MRCLPFLSRCQNLNAWVAAAPLLYETSGAYEPKGLSKTPSGDVMRPFSLQGWNREATPLLIGQRWRAMGKMGLDGIGNIDLVVCRGEALPDLADTTLVPSRAGDE